MEKPSRTQKKKTAQALQKKGERLVALSNADFESLQIPAELKSAVAMARQMTRHEARRRQLQYIGRLMRQIGSEAVDKALQHVAAREADKKRQFKLVEQWRDELVAGNDERLRWLLTRFPTIDATQLESLIESAQGIHPQHNPKNASRKLFRLLSQLDLSQV